MTATHTEGEYSSLSQNSGYSVGVSADKTYDVSGFKDSDWLNGISTLDIVMIQKHILGIKAISEPYMLIAADANNSGGVSAADILELRQVILGSKERFTNNSWIGLNPDYEFMYNAVQEANNARIRTVSVGGNDVTGIDFDVVKIGDVNGSANALESRNASSIRLMADDVLLS
ncbi:dockerin type I domain-containing protein, partial [Arthrospira platensis SPKY1]|nr:dockerin type I domain-containing protein [Arthrospira platensis SPKY1]